LLGEGGLVRSLPSRFLAPQPERAWPARRAPPKVRSARGARLRARRGGRERGRRAASGSTRAARGAEPPVGISRKRTRVGPGGGRTRAGGRAATGAVTPHSPAAGPGQ